MEERQVDHMQTQVRHLSLINASQPEQPTVDGTGEPSIGRNGNHRTFCHIVFHESPNRPGTDRMLYQWFLIQDRTVRMSAVCFDKYTDTGQWDEVSRSETVTITHGSDIGFNYHTRPPCWSQGGDYVVLDGGRTHEDPAQRSRLFLWTVKEKERQARLELIPTTSSEGEVSMNSQRADGTLYHVTGFRFGPGSTDASPIIAVAGYLFFPPEEDDMIVDTFRICEEGRVERHRNTRRGYNFFPASNRLLTLDNDWRLFFWGNTCTDGVTCHSMNEDHDLKDYIHKDFFPIEIVPSPDEKMAVVLQVHTDVMRLILFRINYSDRNTKLLEILPSENRPTKHENLGYGGPYRYLVAFTRNSEVVAASCENSGRIHLYAIREDDVQPLCFSGIEETTLDQSICGVWCQACVAPNFTVREQGDLAAATEMRCSVLELANLQRALPEDFSGLVRITPTVCSFRNGPLRKMTALQVQF